MKSILRVSALIVLATVVASAQTVEARAAAVERQTRLHRRLGSSASGRCLERRGRRLRGRRHRLQERRVRRTVVHAGRQGRMGQEQQADDLRLRVALPAVGIRARVQHAVSARLRASPGSSRDPLGAGQPLPRSCRPTDASCRRISSPPGWARQPAAGRATRSSSRPRGSTAAPGSTPRSIRTAMRCS